MWSSKAWAEGSGSFMPVQGSQIAENVDSLYMFLLVSSLISCVLVIGGMIYFVIKYRRKTENDKTAYITHNHTLEFLWSFIPFVIFMFVFGWGWWIYDEMRTPPEDAFEVHVVGKQWAWEFVYKSGFSSPELVVPSGTDVKLIMTSPDVLHSFYIPAMRVKQDVVPGRYTSVWFNSNLEGEFNVFCTEFCGTSHAYMTAKMRVISPSEFDNWLQESSPAGLTLVERGEKLVEAKGCISCHNVTGPKKIGPTLADVWGVIREFTDGSSATADENYIRESILKPNAKIVKGYAPAMPTFQGQISETELKAVIEYFKSLKEGN